MEISHWQQYRARFCATFEKFKVADRYSALGIETPDPSTCCDGECEGTGVVPIQKGDRRIEYRKAWEAAEKKEKSDDGYHFVKCRVCHGTGKKKALKESMGDITPAEWLEMHPDDERVRQHFFQSMLQ